MVKSNERLVQLACAFKPKVEQGPRYKLGVGVARSPKHGLQMDKESGNSLWKDVTATELKQINTYKTFRKPTAEDNLSDYQMIPYHMVCTM